MLGWASLSRILSHFPWAVQLQAAHQSVAVLGLALVAMTEDLGRTMAYRSLEHLLQYGEPAVRCTSLPPPPQWI